jgi:hypothetical protein
MNCRLGVVSTVQWPAVRNVVESRSVPEQLNHPGSLGAKEIMSPAVLLDVAVAGGYPPRAAAGSAALPDGTATGSSARFVASQRAISSTGTALRRA